MRDQHHIYHRDSYKRVINPTAIRDKARVVLDRSGTTRVAYRMDAKTQRMVNDVFEARAAMHEHVYQHGCALHVLVPRANHVIGSRSFWHGRWRACELRGWVPIAAHAC